MSTGLKETKRGIFALMLAHCTGMVDLVALPVWVGTLVAHYAFDPQQAGALPTLFLVGASIASMVIAPRLNRLTARWVAVFGFGIAAATFFVSAGETGWAILATLHLIGGLAAGSALSVTHGTIGHSSNPHRLFGLAGLAIGLFGVVFLGGAPVAIAHFGGPSLFVLLGALMAVTTVVALSFFPTRERAVHAEDLIGHGAPLGRAVWFCIAGVALLCMTQAMTLSFYERLGMARGFSREMVTAALVIYGVVTIFPAPLAALLERRVAATTVICIGPLFQALFAMTATHTTFYPLYAIAGSMMAFTILFTHTFAFGLLARLDRSGRAVAGTPAMLMVGAAIGPLLGGTMVKFFGFEAIGYTACVLVLAQVILFNQTRRRVAAQSAPLPAAAE